MARLLWLVLAALQSATASPIASPDPELLLNPPPAPHAQSLHVERPLSPDAPTQPEVKFSVVRYGPFAVKAKGMQDGFWTWNIAKPCTDCYITAMEADLQYSDGRTANIEEGAWLHHIVLHNGMGFTPRGSKKDLICSGTIASWGGAYPHRIFSSGNERRVVRLNEKYKVGMVVDTGDEFQMVHDILNWSNKDQMYYIVLKFEWVPKSTPGYSTARMLWVDIAGCNESNMPGREGFYEYKSPGWKSTIAGRLISSSGHTHDGGVYTTLYINEKPVCTSAQLYGTKNGFVEKGDIPNLSNYTEASKKDGAHGHSGGHRLSKRDGSDVRDTTMLHISDTSTCIDFASLKVGDIIKVGATYNTTAHKLNIPVHGHESSPLWKNEKYAPVMGIAPVYVAEGVNV